MMRKTMALAMLMLVLNGVVRANGTSGREHVSGVGRQHLFIKETVEDTSLVNTEVKLPVLPFHQISFEQRLKALEGVVPLDYNEHVQYYIDVFSTRAKEKISTSLGLSQYYFPIYERIFEEEDIPEEIKYLSVVESTLNPHAVSRVGATGPWQFMLNTGKVYGLNIDEWIDERKDPVAASYAAAAYLRDSYNQFGDWLLAIASYNCGSRTIERAIAKAGGESDFWTIRPFLPVETQNYIPAYIATVYAMKYHEQLNIETRRPDFRIHTECLLVNRKVSLADVARAANVTLAELSILNPAYSKKIINASFESPKALVIPLVNIAAYSALYDVLNEGKAVQSTAFYKNKPKPGHRPLYYKVRKGDNLSSIAEKYDIEVRDLMVWNAINSEIIVPGQTLRVSGSEKGLLNITNYFNYRVQPGDTLLKIAEKFDGVTVSGLKVRNDLVNNEIQPGMILKIVRG